MKLTARPLTVRQANAIVEQWHRHHKPVRGHRFSIGAYTEDGKIVGAAIVGRPVARALPHYDVCEVNRLVTDGTPNACSFLYGRAAAVAKLMGFRQIRTYILASEPGTSLKASGWTCMGAPRKNGEGWNNRPGRRDDQPTEQKVLWVKEFQS